ncbi:MAG TPA: DUF2147 domain-containing protein [Nannocystaceae bacterium]|nr:DUF2147 domain-containing protein [Nannocystaceae bacterium]
MRQPVRTRTAHRLGLLAALPALLFVSAPEVEAYDSPVGVWKTIDDDSGEAKSQVKIYERDGKLRGKITKLYNNPDALCEACDGEDYNTPILGMTIMWGLEEDDGEWSGGKIFDPKKGKTYNCKIWLEDDGDLKVRGYAGPFYRTQTWHRVE